MLPVEHSGKSDEANTSIKLSRVINRMDWKKTLNIAAIALVAWLLVVEWNSFNELRRAENPPCS